MLRSASEWSIGTEDDIVERSIQNAYLSLIRDSKHYIYIENQFFISSNPFGNLVQNNVVDALVGRVRQAIEDGKKFKIIIIIPLLPAFSG